MKLNFQKPSLDQVALFVGVLLLALFVAGFFFLRGGKVERSFKYHQHEHSQNQSIEDEHDWGWALKEVERELKDDPGNVLLMGKRAHLLLERKPNKAVEAYQELLDKDEGDAYARLHLAQALARTGEYEKAMGYAAELLKEDRAIEVLELVAHIHYAKGNFSSTIRFAEEILSRQPDHGSAELLRDYSKRGLALQR